MVDGFAGLEGAGLPCKAADGGGLVVRRGRVVWWVAAAAAVRLRLGMVRCIVLSVRDVLRGWWFGLRRNWLTWASLIWEYWTACGVEIDGRPTKIGLDYGPVS